MRYQHSHVHSRVIYNSQDAGATKCALVDEWINRSIYDGIRVKKGNSAIYNTMNEPQGHYTK